MLSPTPPLPSLLTHPHTPHPLQQCEYCRLYSGCFLSSRNQTAQCLELCGPDFIPNLTPERFAHMYTNVDVEELRADHLLNYFGQVFYSQFTGTCVHDLSGLVKGGGGVVLYTSLCNWDFRQLPD